MDTNGLNHEWTRMDTNEGAAGSLGFAARAMCWWSKSQWGVELFLSMRGVCGGG